MARQKYQPPKQSVLGQIIDAALVLIAVFLALWVPLALNLAGASTRTILPAGVTQQTAADGTVTFAGATWENLGQNAVMQKQWEALGYDVNSAAALITQWFDYSFSWSMMILTTIAVIAYFVFAGHPATTTSGTTSSPAVTTPATPPAATTPSPAATGASPMTATPPASSPATPAAPAAPKAPAAPAAPATPAAPAAPATGK